MARQSEQRLLGARHDRLLELLHAQSIGADATDVGPSAILLFPCPQAQEVELLKEPLHGVEVSEGGGLARGMLEISPELNGVGRAGAPGPAETPECAGEILPDFGVTGLQERLAGLRIDARLAGAGVDARLLERGAVQVEDGAYLVQRETISGEKMGAVGSAGIDGVVRAAVLDAERTEEFGRGERVGIYAQFAQIIRRGKPLSRGSGHRRGVTLTVP